MTLKESKLFEELRNIINLIIVEKRNIKSEIAEKVSEFVNPKDLVDAINKVQLKLDTVDKEISKVFKHGMLLVSRGVQDEGQLEEHLAEHYQKRKRLTKELENSETKLKKVRTLKKEKTLKILDQIDVTTHDLGQEELELFIEDIVVNKKDIEVTTTIGTKHKIDISKLQ